MSEFGNETATAAMRTGEKTLEAIFKLLRFITEMKRAKTDAEYKSAMMKQYKMKSTEAEAKEYLNNSRGKIRKEKLEQSGEKIIPISTPLSKEELRTFNNYANSYGVPFAAIADKPFNEQIKKIKDEIKHLEKESVKRELSIEEKDSLENLRKQLQELNNKRTEYTIFIRAKDLDKVNIITEKMNRDIHLKNIDNELKVLKEKENPSQEDLDRIKELEHEKDKTINSEFDNFNSRNNDSLINENEEDLCNGKPMSFETAVEDACVRENIEKPVYICERTNPNNYMEVNITREASPIRENEEYRNTEFKVFKNNVQQNCEEFSHGKFTRCSWENGEQTTDKGQEHWDNLKQEMKQKGEFTNDMLYFSSKENFEKYKESFNKTKEQVDDHFKDALAEADTRNSLDNVYIVNANNPNNYIVAQKKFIGDDEGNMRSTTDYTLYKDGIRTESYNNYFDKEKWNEVINDLKEKGEFDKNILIYKKEEEFDKYRNEFIQSKQNDNSKNESYKNIENKTREDVTYYEGNYDSYVDYTGMINMLKGHLDDHNLILNEQGNLLNKMTNNSYVKANHMTDDEKLEFMEAINVAKQIGILKKLNDLQVQKALYQAQYEKNKDAFEKQGSPDAFKEMYDSNQKTLTEQVKAIDSQMKELSIKESSLIKERNYFISATAYSHSRVDYEDDMLDFAKKGREHELNGNDNQHYLGIESWNKQIESHNDNFAIASVDVPAIETERE